MNCADAREWLSDAIDDALEADARAQLDAHLAGCPDCLRELERLRAMVSMLRAVERPRAPVGFAERVLAAARPVPWHRRLRDRLAAVRVLGFPVEAAGIVLVATLAVYIFVGTPSLRRAAQLETDPHRTADTRALEERRPAASDASSWKAARHAKEAPLPPPPNAAPAPPTPALSDAHETLTREDAEVTTKAEEPRSNAGKAAASGDRASSPTFSMGPAMNAPPLPSGPAAPAPAASPVAPPGGPAPVPPVPGSPYATSPDGAESMRRSFHSEAAPGQPSPAPAAPQLGDRAQLERNLEPSQRAARLPEFFTPMARRLASSSQVIGRLTVRDRQAADLELAELLKQVGGTEKTRIADAAGTSVNVVVPRAAYPVFAKGLSRIGTWQPATQPTDLPEDVSVTLRIAQ